MMERPWIERRGVADAILDIVLDPTARFPFPDHNERDAQFVSVPLLPDNESPNAWDCRLVVVAPGNASSHVKRVEAHFLSPEDVKKWLPVGAEFSVYPGRFIGRGIVVEWIRP